MPMKGNSRTKFEGYSYLDIWEIERLDNAIGYTFGLSDEYVKMVEERGESVEDVDFQIYMDEAVEEIETELYNHEKFSDYIKSIHPQVNIDTLSTQDFNKYRIEFIMNYVNAFAGDLSYIDKRDFFESLITRLIDYGEGNLKLFSGKDKNDEMVTILKYEGDIAEEDLLYIIQGGHEIKAIDAMQVQKFIEDGFKTISNGKEQFIIRQNEPFQKTTHNIGRKINLYIYESTDLEERAKRKQMVKSALLLQECNQGISEYMEAIYKSEIQNSTSNEIIERIYENFVENIRRYEYDRYIPQEDLEIEKQGIDHLLSNMHIIREILEHEAAPVLQMIKEYMQELKTEAKSNNIMLYHVSTIAPYQLQDMELKPMYNKSQYFQNFGKMLCASTDSVISNAYLMARVNGKGMCRLPIGKKSYLLGGDNVYISKQKNGQVRAISKIPGYIYYVPIEDFVPSIRLCYDKSRDEYYMEFDGEWTSDKALSVPEHVADNIKNRGDTKEYPEGKDLSEVYAVEQYTDVTSILEHNQIIINKKLRKQDIYIITRRTPNARKTILKLIREGKIHYLNGVAGINAIGAATNIYNGPVITYDGEKIMEGSSIVSPNEVRAQKIKLSDFVQNAIRNGITYGNYTEIMKYGISNIENFSEEQKKSRGEVS